MTAKACGSDPYFAHNIMREACGFKESRSNECAIINNGIQTLPGAPAAIARNFGGC
jgi:hypothetical protein